MMTLVTLQWPTCTHDDPPDVSECSQQPSPSPHQTAGHDTRGIQGVPPQPPEQIHCLRLCQQKLHAKQSHNSIGYIISCVSRHSAFDVEVVGGSGHPTCQHRQGKQGEVVAPVMLPRGVLDGWPLPEVKYPKYDPMFTAEEDAKDCHHRNRLQPKGDEVD